MTRIQGSEIDDSDEHANSHVVSIDLPIECSGHLMSLGSSLMSRGSCSNSTSNPKEPKAT
jgi:hypothetical protein